MEYMHLNHAYHAVRWLALFFQQVEAPQKQCIYKKLVAKVICVSTQAAANIAAWQASTSKIVYLFSQITIFKYSVLSLEPASFFMLLKLQPVMPGKQRAQCMMIYISHCVACTLQTIATDCFTHSTTTTYFLLILISIFTHTQIWSSGNQPGFVLWSYNSLSTQYLCYVILVVAKRRALLIQKQ